MGRKRLPMPSREQFVALWYDQSITMVQIGERFGVSEATIGGWANRFDLGPRYCGGRRPRGTAPPPELAPHENHCREVNDGPLPGDPTPADIAMRAAELRAAHMEEKRKAIWA